MKVKYRWRVGDGEQRVWIRRIVPGDELVARVDAVVNGDTVTGSRYPPQLQASVDTERMPTEA